MYSNKESENDCIEFRKMISAYIDDELGVVGSRALADHLLECHSCKRELENSYIMRDMVKESFVPKLEVNFSKNVMGRIKHNALPKAVPLPKVNYTSKAIKYGSIAAIMLFAITATVLYSQNEAKVMTAENRKFETYAIEHSDYSSSPFGSVAASVLSVNFDR